MRLLALFAIIMLVPGRSNAQTDVAGADGRPWLTVTAGLGSAMGWAGLQAETYFRNGRISVFGGVGHASGFDDAGEVPGHYSGAAFAGGLRVYTKTTRHRGFLEFSDSVIAVLEQCGSDCRSFYGPGVQAGYQFLARRGFTATASIGYGYSPSASSGAWIGGFGAGYTWRRK